MSSNDKIICNKVSGCLVMASGLGKDLRPGRTHRRDNTANFIARLTPLATVVLFILSGNAAATGLRAEDVAVTVDDQVVVTTAGKDYGAMASGSNGVLTMNGGSLATSGENAYGAVASDGGTINLNNLSVTTSGGSLSHGLYATRNGTLNADGVTVHAGPNTAVYALSNSHLTFTDGTISGYRGLVAGNGSTIVASGGVINTTGVGIFASQSTINADAMEITTTATSGYGAASGSGASTHVTLSNSKVTTQGASAHGMYVSGGAGATSSAVDYTTSGANAHGAYVTGAGSLLDIDGGSITTSGTGSYGLVAGSGATINAENVAITATDRALYASNGTINAKNLTISGNEGGSGLNMFGDGEIHAQNLTLNISNDSGSAANPVGIYLDGNAGTQNTVTLENSSLTLSGAGATAIQAAAGNSIVTLKNTVINAINGVAIYANSAGLTVNLDGASVSGNTLLQGGSLSDPAAVVDAVTLRATNGSQLTGDVSINQDQTTASEIALDGASVWSGAASGLHNLSLTDGSHWNLTQSSAVDTVTLDNSTINMAPQGSGFSTLTVGNLIGNNGTIAFKTQLAGDESQTDRLHVTGDYSGNTAVSVENAGGSGAQTLQGINLIQVDGTVGGTFSQQGRIVAGAYDYFLTRGTGADSGKWYLSSASNVLPVDPVDPVDPVVPVDPVDPATPVDPVVPVDPTKPVDPVVPVIPVVPETPDNSVKPVDGPVTPIARPEAGSYAANLAAANTLFTTRQDDRMGETRYTDFVTGEARTTSLWLRNEGGHQRSKDSSGQLKTTGNRYVMQLGGDVAQWTRNGGDKFNLGVMGGYANAQSHTRSGVTGFRSQGEVHGYSAGVYAGWQQDNAAKTGAYLDSWVLYNWFNNSVKGEGLPEEHYRSTGVTASLEGGYTFKVGELNARQSYYLQPKAQATWMGVKADDHTESNGTRVTGSGNNNVQTHLGLRAFIKGHSQLDEGTQRTFEPFVEANWIHNTRSAGSTLDGVNIHQAGVRDIGELKVGVDAKATNRVSLWGHVGQQLGAKGYSDTSATLGIKVNF